MNLDFKARIARLTTATTQGTAFLISPTRALTCAHCLVEGNGKPPSMRATLTFPNGTRIASTVHVDLDLDFAMLELEPLGASALSVRGTVVSGVDWATF